MIAPLVLAAATLAASPQAAPGDWVTVSVRDAPPRKLVRVYLVPATDQARVRSARDPQLHYVGSGRARSGTVTVSFRVPPLNGPYLAWCAGCGAGGTLNVVMPASTADACPVTIPQTGPPRDGSLSVSGRRIDGAPPPLRVHAVNRGLQSGYDGATWATVISFPTQGCWRLTARVANLSAAVSLSFVMKVTVA